MAITLHVNVLYGRLPRKTLTDMSHITEVGSVYCTVRSESLYNTDKFRL